MIGVIGSPSNVMNWLSSGTELAAYFSGSFEYYGAASAAAATDRLFVKFAGLRVSSLCAFPKGYECKKITHKEQVQVRHALIMV